jgi:hypothetical protein
MHAARPLLLLLTIHAEMAVRPIESPVPPAARANGYAVQYRPVVSKPGLSIFMREPTSRIAHPSRDKAGAAQ